MALALVPGVGRAQARDAAEPGQSLHVSLITVGPGRSVSSRFGHGLLRVQDLAVSYDRTYSFGRSGLDGPMAVSSLIQGRLPAGGGITEADSLLRLYEDEGRSIWIQELNILPEQKRALTRLLEQERGVGEPYDFFASNCTTLLRDVLDSAMGGRIRAVTEARSTTTFRARVAGYTASDPVLSTLVDFLMSDAGDRGMSEWEGLSLPAALRDRLRRIMVPDAAGELGPVVQRETVRVGSLPDQDPEPRSQRWAGHLVIGLALGAVLAWLGAVSTRQSGARFGFAVLGGAWTLGVGLGGLILAALWAFSSQTMMRGNENLFQANPLILLLGVMTWGSAANPRWARALALATVGIAATGLVVKVLPAFDQANGAIVALLFPSHVGLAWGLWRGGSNGS